MTDIERAEELIAGYCEGTLDEGETAELNGLMESSPEILEMVREVRGAEKMVRMLNAPGSSDEAWERICVEMFRTARGRKTRRITRIISAAAVVAVVCFVAYFIEAYSGKQMGTDEIAAIMPGTTVATLVLPDGETILLGDDIAGSRAVTPDSILTLMETRVFTSDYGTINVPRGGYYKFTLSDGSVIHLNSESTVYFPCKFEESERNIYVMGEVYLEVARDESRSFIVHAGESRIEVLGTRFNVSAYPNDERIVTTLVSGSVEFSAEEYKDKLNPGEQTVWGPESGIYIKRKVDTSLYTSWVDGSFQFEKVPMSDIANQLSRWYEVDFIFNSEELADYLFTGVSSRDRDLSVILNAISKTTNIQFELKENKIHVKKKDE